ncbi:MAG TPA: hypothetical protein VGS97_06310 [Actinocrinis sp.]|uniref:hypothetical protein n=1 Tax=Actinocrinis sp. TaxID=1920516 RepID=UPI002DDCABBD|nr:hypothetical protein [Actinocrinis sp.]HEV2343684.1 hypothetical protein [Actinocrinis sp.]
MLRGRSLRYCLVCRRLTLRGLFPGYWRSLRVHPWCIPRLRRVAKREAARWAREHAGSVTQ